MVASLVWVAAAAFYASSLHDRDVQRLKRWADTIEADINADPMVRMNAQQLRARVGDEAFIAAAARAYPHIDLRQTMHSYHQDMAAHPLSRNPLATFAIWGLVPPLVLFIAGLLMDALLAFLRRRAPPADGAGTAH